MGVIQRIKRAWWCLRGWEPIHSKYILVHKVGNEGSVDSGKPFIVRAIDPDFLALWVTWK